MNIFYLHKDPVESAKLHCDKHVCKMIIEYAQMLSTAHRMLDGKEYISQTLGGRRIKQDGLITYFDNMRMFENIFAYSKYVSKRPFDISLISISS